MWHSPTKRLIEKDPAKRAGKWKVESGIFFMWVDKFIESDGVSRPAGKSYGAPRSTEYLSPQPNTGPLIKIDISREKISGYKDKDYEGVQNLLNNSTGGHSKWYQCNSLCMEYPMNYFNLKLSQKNHIRAIGLRTANDCPNRDPWKFEVYAKPFPEDYCPPKKVGSLDIEAGFYLICKVDNCDWGNQRWTEKQWKLNDCADVYTEFKFVFFKTKKNGSHCHDDGI